MRRTVARKKRDIAVLLSMPSEMTGDILSTALNRQMGIRVVGRVSSTLELLSAVANIGVDVAIISAAMEDGELSGLSVIPQLRRDSPQIKVIILFDSPNRQAVVEAFRAGAKGVFCPAHSSFKHLCRCVAQVHAGQIWARSEELNDVMSAFSRYPSMKMVDAKGLPLLTKREEDVVRLLAEGYQNREIARELRLSEHTVKNYLFRVFEKLGISSRVELVLYAVSSMHRGDGRKVESKIDGDSCRKTPLHTAEKFGPCPQKFPELSAGDSRTLLEDVLRKQGPAA
jgi:DNA-binding NarL/FixJ family response regulator